MISGDKQYRCALGRTGVSLRKQEGDGATPSGTFPLLQVYYRKDRVAALETGLPISRLDANDGWCDDPDHGDYNSFVHLPHSGSCETLWRNDHLYDLVVIIGHNTRPAAPGLGSAIFIHVAGPDYPPTEGCVALALGDLEEILRGCSRQSVIRILSA